MSFILLLEDDNLQVTLLTDLIQYQLGFITKSTTSIDEALLLAAEEPDLIISDICLTKPLHHLGTMDKSGIEFCRLIKSNPDTQEIPFILRSSMPLSHFETAFQETKADIFLNKSTSSTELLQTIQQFLHDDTTTQALHCA